MNQNIKRQSILLLAYQVVIIVLAVISIALSTLDIFGKLSLSDEPFKSIDLGILLVFVVDYAVRIIRSEDKTKFMLHNIPDLLAIIPFYSLFSMFRIFRILKIARVGKLLKATRLFRLGAFASVFSKRVLGILNTNGLRYVLYVNVALIMTASGIMTYTENMSFQEALWWSLVTCTTVGYGDVVPTTIYGKITAAILMLLELAFSECLLVRLQLTLSIGERSRMKLNLTILKSYLHLQPMKKGKKFMR